MLPVPRITGRSSRLPSHHLTSKRFGLEQTTAMSRLLRTGEQLGKMSPIMSACLSIHGSAGLRPPVLIQALPISLVMGIGQRTFAHISSRQPTTGLPGLKSLTESLTDKLFTWSKKTLKTQICCSRGQNSASSTRSMGVPRGIHCSETCR